MKCVLPLVLFVWSGVVMADEKKMPALIHTEADLDMVGRTVFGEARGEAFLGKVAVAWVIRNRVQNPSWWGKTIQEVCKKPFQFSCWNSDDPNAKKCVEVTKENLSFVDSCAAARLVLNGHHEDPTNGATHYRVTGTPAAWAKGKEPVVTIGRHEFYNDID